jgi:drug/metabolite transporter (DMT)-like permease
MQPVHTISLVGFAFCMSVAQIVLKIGVQNAQEQSGASVASLFFALIATWQFWFAVLLTGSLVFLWSWILSVVPLSTAYPFVVLALVFAGILEHFLFGQALSPNFFIGCALILAGLMFVLRA